ncbi:hypothetical protein [Rhodopirellula bahusiensis]|uniref:Uncharacterized protein n=1 Tax=Rhodopirellula bahusiensis TaxID=2014065 RepID=A0A2G1W540_9BACT|nr:hypothetical protein [Rhodopirellula bahusiensis]PHQ34157.1 hypothetical protein CEE69_16015 [Rhodopirellula bahusiensis]
MKLKRKLQEIDELCDDYLAGTILFVPEDLKDRLENEKLDRRRREGYYLTWSVIRNGYFETDESSWRYIHGDNFEKIGSNGTMPHDAKAWLEKNGFIKWDQSYVAENIATGKNEARPQRYRVHDWGKTTVKRLESKNVISALVRNKPVEPELQYSQHQLDLLTPDVGHLKHIMREVLICNWQGVDIRNAVEREFLFDQIEKSGNSAEKKGKPGEYRTATFNFSSSLDDWRDSSVQTFGLPVLKLLNRRGIVKRGNSVRRLFSPLTSLMREFRQGFFYAGQPWVNCDLICSQPTLLSYQCGNTQFTADCLDNSFYNKIAESLNVSRDEAKRAYCAFAYGPNRTPKSRNKPALAVQHFMKETYKSAHDHIWNCKRGDHRRFIRSLQDREATIFIDDIYAELRRRRLPVLSIHDSVITTAKNEEEVLSVIKSKLKKEGIEQQVKVERKRRQQETESNDRGRHI